MQTSKYLCTTPLSLSFALWIYGRDMTYMHLLVCRYCWGKSTLLCQYFNAFLHNPHVTTHTASSNAKATWVWPFEIWEAVRYTPTALPHEIVNQTKIQAAIKFVYYFMVNYHEFILRYTTPFSPFWDFSLVYRCCSLMRLEA